MRTVIVADGVHADHASLRHLSERVVDWDVQPVLAIRPADVPGPWAR
ncbi:hypothetical protein [Kocuria tytonis]|nr:hypothetical protein [Kocuria tytonis]